MVDEHINIKQSIKRNQRRNFFLTLILLLALILIMLFSISFGRADLSFSTVAKIITGKLINSKLLDNFEEYVVVIVWDIRVPRVLIGALVGAGLAVSGTVFQSILRNPLADPYTIGVSTGAAFGAVLAIFLNLFVVNKMIPIMPSAFIGAICTLLVVLKISLKDGYISSSNLILAGIIVSSILSAGISFLKSLSGEEVAAIVYWLMGSLSSKTWTQVMISFPIILIGIILCKYFADDLDIMTLGEKEARSLGVDPGKITKVYLVLASLITAVCVSVSGIIGFVGLIVPHILRFAVSTKNKILIPLSAICGALLLVLADNLSRLLLNVEIPVGVITTLFGGPFFIYIFFKKRR
ncbi:iron complex transport system permease protein [Caminicella sporogenes DSM 14501]|uniref:Iron complex transport system permease protein n=1 Tax=Caminicella sporogenes DSM 14501 TaxID=1121266 RepID=A0A1M6PFT2_9FIRM|nr:iron ABC transporter permease [Caminicella sporogenes]RKD21415.1 iron ABC transporter permease [Caminicella sporogenes]SHK06803.1 iron complex transport system permease protein [Caminicella sporogenes DSM 14501]